MSAQIPAPPRLAERLLAAVLGGRLFGPDLLGDLAERHAALARGAPHRAALDYWRAALSLAFRFAPAALGAWSTQLAFPHRSLHSHRPRHPTTETSMNQLLFDLKLSLRSLARRPGITAVVVATLAIGLAANVTVLGIFDALVLRPFAFDESDRLVLLTESGHGVDEFERTNLSPAALRDLRAESHDALEALVGYDGWNANLRGSESPEKVQGYRTDPELFRALRISPAAGRFFSAEESAFGSAPVVVLGHELWLRRFGGAPAVIGSTIDIDGRGHTVVGVAPPDFAFPTGAEVWAPLTLSPEEAAHADQHQLGAFGRLAPGVSLAAARASFDRAAGRLSERYPEQYRGRGVTTWTLGEALRDQGLMPILALFQAAGLFVLAIGWMNVANLILARGQERRRELALLDALGAGRSRLVRLQLSEGALLGLAAAAASLPFSALGQRLVHDLLPVALEKYMPGWASLGLDLRAVGFTLALAVVSIMAVSLWPAISGSGRGLGSVLREAGRGGTAGARTQRGKSALIVSEIAVALMLVVAAGLSSRAAQRVSDGPQGYDPEGLLTFRVALPEGRYPEPAARRELVRETLARLAALPGVESVAASNVLPATGNNSSEPIALEGEAELDPGTAPQADERAVSPGFFRTLRLPIVAGRELTSGDDETSPPVAIVSRSMAERHWPGRDPLGRRFCAGAVDAPWLTVVGVAGDHLHHWFSRRDAPTYFVPAAQDPRRNLAFILRTANETESFAREVRAAFAAVDPYQPLFDLRSQRAAINENTVGLRFVSGVMTVFAILALVLAISGVYGVMAYRVSLREREIGVRVALGATLGEVLRATVGQALRPAGIGLALGLAGSVAVGKLLGSVLRGVAGFEPSLAFGAAALLAGAAVVSAIVPARRALALDPAEVLRAE